MWGRLRSDFAIRPALGLAGLLVMVTPVWPIGQASAATQQRGAAHVTPCTMSSPSLSASGAPAPGFPVSTAEPGPPRGLIAAEQYSPGQPLFTPSEMVFDNRAIAGVQVIAAWDDLEPHLGIFNWAPVDKVFAQADASHKFVVLTLVLALALPLGHSPILFNGRASTANTATTHIWRHPCRFRGTRRTSAVGTRSSQR
jgi:hypothetical protein